MVSGLSEGKRLDFKRVEFKDSNTLDSNGWVVHLESHPRWFFHDVNYGTRKKNLLYFARGVCTPADLKDEQCLFSCSNTKAPKMDDKECHRCDSDHRGNLNQGHMTIQNCPAEDFEYPESSNTELVCAYDTRDGYPDGAVRRVPFPWSAIESDDECKKRCLADPGTIAYVSQTDIHCWCYTSSTVDFSDPIWEGSFGEAQPHQVWDDWASEDLVTIAKWNPDSKVISGQYVCTETCVCTDTELAVAAALEECVAPRDSVYKSVMYFAAGSIMGGAAIYYSITSNKLNS